MRWFTTKRCVIIIFLLASFGGLILNITHFRTLDSSKKEYPVGKIAMSADSSVFDGPPIILWWADLIGEPWTERRCGSSSCYVTNNRSYLQDPRTQAVMFYGSTLDLADLPLPRKSNHRWAIIHEESPKNNWAFCNEDLMRLFTFTSTFRRFSDFPLTLTWLRSIEEIESKRYYHTFEEKEAFMMELSLSPIAYIQSDCDTPSDRDRLVELLSKHFAIDSLGQCLNNKQLPKHLFNNMEGMEHKDFFELLSKYKFVIAAENAICEDYITEKFWRSFYVGTVPIVYGSPTIKEWLPSPGSALIVQDYESMDSLVKAINDLNTNSAAYNNAISYKISGVTNRYLRQQMKSRTWGLGNDEVNFPDAFQCYICERIAGSVAYSSVSAAVDRGLQCPAPTEFMKDETPTRKKEFWWPTNYMHEYRNGASIAARMPKN